MKRVLHEVLGGAAFIVAMFATVILLLMCSGHKTYAAETWTDIGSHRITFYCNCSACCGKWAGGKTASGTIPTRYRTAAVSTKEIEMGTVLFIDGVGFRVAEDTGVSRGTIDVFCPDHQHCLDLGVLRRTVWIVTGREDDDA